MQKSGVELVTTWTDKLARFILGSIVVLMFALGIYLLATCTTVYHDPMELNL